MIRVCDRFSFPLQEEQWHEADTFPSVPTNKNDVVLFLGKRPPPHPQPFTPAETLIQLSASAAADSTTTGGSALETGPTAEGHRGDDCCTAVSGVKTGDGIQEDHRGAGTGTGSAATRKTDPTGGGEWDGDTIDEYVEEESDADEEMDGRGAGAPSSCSSVRANSAAGESTESGADPARPRGAGMRKRLSSRLANWPPFSKPKVKRLVSIGDS